MAGLNRQISAAKDVETSAYTTLGAAILANNIQDQDTLLKSVPGGLQMWNSLPISQRMSLIGDMHHEANDLTAGREENIRKLDGEFALRRTDPNQFLNEDVTSMDLRAADRIKYLKMQEELRNKPEGAGVEDKTLHAALAPTLIGQYMQQFHIQPKSGAYYLMVGGIQQEIKGWEDAHGGTSPGPKDLPGLVARVMANQYHQTKETSWWNPWDPGKTVISGAPQKDIDAATASLARRGIPNPTKQQLGARLEEYYNAQR